jgi:hypothetical protein
LAKFSQNQLWPGTPDSDRWCRLARRQLGALRKRERRRDYNSPDCPVVHRTVRWCTGLSGESTAPAANDRPRDQRATRGRANGRLGTPDYLVRQPIPRTNGGCAPHGKKSSTGLLQWLSCGAPGWPVHHSTEGKNCLPN